MSGSHYCPCGQQFAIESPTVGAILTCPHCNAHLRLNQQGILKPLPVAPVVSQPIATAPVDPLAIPEPSLPTAGPLPYTTPSVNPHATPNQRSKSSSQRSTATYVDDSESDDRSQRLLIIGGGIAAVAFLSLCIAAVVLYSGSSETTASATQENIAEEDFETQNTATQNMRLRPRTTRSQILIPQRRPQPSLIRQIQSIRIPRQQNHHSLSFRCPKE